LTTLQISDTSRIEFDSYNFPMSNGTSNSSSNSFSAAPLEAALRQLGAQADWLVDYYSDATSTSVNDVVASVLGLFARPADVAPLTSKELVLEVHDRSGLTWEQIARALGVSKRAVLMWARDAQVSAANLDNLSSLRALVVEFAGMNVDETRMRLITSSASSIAPLAVWVESRVERASKPNAPYLNAAALMG